MPTKQTPRQKLEPASDPATLYWYEIKLPRGVRSEVFEQFEHDGCRCAVCGKPVLPKEEPYIEHIVPRSKGGKDEVSNLHFLHIKCRRFPDPADLVRPKRRSLPAAVRRAVLAQFEESDHICALCEDSIDPDDDDIHIDHIVPLDQGGTNEITNLHVVHSRCNSLKGRGTLGDGQKRSERRQHHYEIFMNNLDLE